MVEEARRALTGLLPPQEKAEAVVLNKIHKLPVSVGNGSSSASLGTNDA